MGFGKNIAQKQKEANWGDAILEQLSVDLKLAFPQIKGFSRRNLYAIKQWYNFYCNEKEFVPQLVAQIPWRHNRLISSKIQLKNLKIMNEGGSKYIFEINPIFRLIK